MEETRLDDLNLDGLKINQYINGYSFTSDAVLLANFVSAGHKSVCVEVGSGSGVISILLNYKQNPKQIYAVEIQEKLAKLTENNAKMNKMDNISVINTKFQDVNKYLQNGSVDVVFSNPPYYKVGACIENPNEELSICRHEKMLPLVDLCLYSSKLLKEGGKFYVVYPASRTSELFVELTKNRLQPKRVFFAQPTNSKNASVVFVEATKGGKLGMIVMPTLITNDLDGNYVQTIQKLYRKEEK